MVDIFKAAKTVKTKEPASSVIEKKCEFCKKPISVRAVDVHRGWGRFCSKSCKAKDQQKKSRIRRINRSYDYEGEVYCQQCGEPAITGVWSPFGKSNGIEWQCEYHRDDTHHFDMG